MKNSILLIGIDGASWGLLKPWIDSGELPILKKLMDKGVSGNLKSTIPPESGSAWVSLASGKNPGKHGIFSFVTKEGKVINATFVKSDRIWHILSSHSKRSCIINIPVTYPLEKINGYMVSSFLTPPDEKVYSYPPELMGLLHKFGYKIDIKYEKYGFIPNEKNILEKRDYFLKEFYDILEKRYLTVKELMNEPCDLFMVNFKECDGFQHIFWDKKEVMLEFFKKLDNYIDELATKFSSKNHNPFIFVVSDHGFASSPTRSFNLRAWMLKEKLLIDKRNITQKIVPRLYRRLTKLPYLKSLFNFNRAKEIRKRFQKNLIDKSYIFYRNCGIYINEKNLPNDNYEDLRNKLIRQLINVRDPKTNEAIFQLVKKREDLYSGSYIDNAPDIIALAKHNYTIIFSYESDSLFDNIIPNLPGRHLTELYGILIAKGPEIDYSTIENASILDICPTLLHILDIPIPGDVDGKVLRSIFKEDSPLSQKDIVFSEEEEGSFEEKEKIKSILHKIKI